VVIYKISFEKIGGDISKKGKIKKKYEEAVNYPCGKYGQCVLWSMGCIGDVATGKNYTLCLFLI